MRNLVRRAVLILAGAAILSSQQKSPYQDPAAPAGPARRRPALAHDARREDLAAHERLARHRPPRRSRLQLVERMPARRRARRTRHRLSRRPSGWPPPGTPTSCSASPPPSPTRLAPSTTSSSAAASATSIRASPSGRPTSTSFAIRAGAAAWRPTAKIPTSPAAWPSQFIKGMQGDDPKYLQDHRHRQALRRAQRTRVLAPHLRRRGQRRATCAKPTCRTSKRPSARAARIP